MQVKKKDKMYYARILPTAYVYDVCDLTIRTVEDDWFVGMDKHDKHAYLFTNSDIGKSVFWDRASALDTVRLAERSKPINYNEEENEEDECN